jgi:hypothetical protein
MDDLAPDDLVRFEDDVCEIGPGMTMLDADRLFEGEQACTLKHTELMKKGRARGDGNVIWSAEHDGFGRPLSELAPFRLQTSGRCSSPPGHRQTHLGEGHSFKSHASR